MGQKQWRILTLAAAIILVLSIVAGCAKTQDNKTAVDTGADSKSSPQATSGSGKETTITFWHHYSSASPEEKTLTNVLIPKFEQENPGIKVKAVAYAWDDLHKKIQISGSAGELPDVARLDIIWVPEFQKSNLLVPLDQEFSDFNEFAKGALAGPLSTGKVGEHYYGMPLNTNTKVLFWNKAVFDKGGVASAPATVDDFFAAIGKLKPDKGWGFGEPALQGWNVLPWLWSNGADVLSPDFKTAEGYFNSSAAVSIVAKLQDAYKKGQISGFKSGDVPVTEGYAKGSYGMMVEGPWAFAQFQQQFPDFKAMTAPFPKGSTGSVQVLGGEDIGIFNKGNKEASWKFVKFMTSEFAQVEMGKMGLIPVNLKAMDNQDIKSIAYFTPFLEQLKTSKARPPVAVWPQIDQVISDTMNSIFLTGKDVKSELDAAVKKIDGLLKS